MPHPQFRGVIRVCDASSCEARLTHGPLEIIGVLIPRGTRFLQWAQLLLGCGDCIHVARAGRRVHNVWRRLLRTGRRAGAELLDHELHISVVTDEKRQARQRQLAGAPLSVG